MLSPPLAGRRLAPPLLALGLLALAGCTERDEIRTYTAPRTPSVPSQPKVRLLAAIIDNKPDQWYFKLLGPTDEVGKYADGFRRFVETVRLTADKDKPIKWDAPAGWQEEPGKGIRHATLHLGEKGEAPQLGVFHFDRISSVLENVNRWCEMDLGRPPVREADLDKYTQKGKAGPHEVVFVDITGPGVRPGARPPMTGKGGKAPGPLPIAYDTPAGWKETGPRVSERMGIRVKIFTAFDVGDGKRAETTVQVFPAQFGDWASNLNRWRREVGLGELAPPAAAKARDRKITTAGGVSGTYVDLAGEQKRSLVVVLEKGKQAWFFKLVGDKDVVAANRERFESFVQSVKFTGAADE